MNSFCERFLAHSFCYVLPLLRHYGAEHDACSAQWCHHSYEEQVCRPVGPMDVIVPPHPGAKTPLPAVHKSKEQAIHTYAEAHFPAPYLIGLLLELGARRSGFSVVSQQANCATCGGCACGGCDPHSSHKQCGGPLNPWAYPQQGGSR